MKNMEFELRENEIFSALEKLKTVENIVLIGGYSLNAYVMFPRFSVDCDFVVYEEDKIIKILEKEGFKTVKRKPELDFKDFIRLEKKVNSSNASIDLMLKKLIDRQSGITFEFSDILKNSKVRELPAKSDPSLNVKFRVVDPEFLFLLKFASLRDQDIRDIFILQTYPLKKDKIKEFIKKYIKDDIRQKNVERLKESIESSNFRDSLQGPYGRLPDGFIDENKEKLLRLVT
jgi:hypothetical protein